MAKTLKEYIFEGGIKDKHFVSPKNYISEMSCSPAGPSPIQVLDLKSKRFGSGSDNAISTRAFIEFANKERHWVPIGYYLPYIECNGKTS